MGRIRPVFSKRMPPNAFAFFDLRADDEFRREHPVLYFVLALAGLLAFIGPYSALAQLSWSALGKDLYHGGWGMLAFVGSLVFGIGPFNIIAAFLHQHLGHRVTVVSLVAGSCLMAVAAYCAPPV